MLSKIHQFTFLIYIWLVCPGEMVFSEDNPHPHLTILSNLSKCEATLKALAVKSQPFFQHRQLVQEIASHSRVLPPGTLFLTLTDYYLFFIDFLIIQNDKTFFNSLGFFADSQEKGMYFPSVDYLNKRLALLRQQGFDFPFNIISVPPGQVERMQWRRFLGQRNFPVSQWDPSQSEFANKFFFHDILDHLPGVLFLPSKMVDRFQGNMKMLFIIYDFLKEMKQKEFLPEVNNGNAPKDSIDRMLEDVTQMIMGYGTGFEVQTGLITLDLVKPRPVPQSRLRLYLKNSLDLLIRPHLDSRNIDFSSPHLILEYFENRLRSIPQNQESHLDEALRIAVQEGFLQEMNLPPLSEDKLMDLVDLSLRKMRLLPPP